MASVHGRLDKLEQSLGGGVAVVDFTTPDAEQLTLEQKRERVLAAGVEAGVGGSVYVLTWAGEHPTGERLVSVEWWDDMTEEAGGGNK